MGEKEPLEDDRTSHGMCSVCEEKMNEKIPFNDWSRSRIKRGIKVCTSRHKKYTKDPRVTWISPKLPWWFIRKYLYQAEGAFDGMELQTVIDGIYKRQVKDDELFYVHFGDFKQ